VESRAAGVRGLLARVVFSAKESVYKALAPHVRTILEFHDVEVDVHAIHPLGALDARGVEGGGRAIAAARLLRSDLPFDADESLSVHHAMQDGLILTAVVLRA